MAGKKQPIKICRVEDCSEPHSGRGWCGKHYQNWRRTGDPTRGRLELRPPRIKVDERFGRLTVLEDVPFITRKVPCLCDCGRKASPRADGLLSGAARSCGCLNRDAITTHGLSKHELYPTWMMMVHRTTNPRNTEYPHYGARGITVCPEWHDVTAFIGWIEANLGPRPEGMTLDRINVNGHYEPGNVRWATWSVQQTNRQLNEQVRLLAAENGRLRAEIAELTRQLGKTSSAVALNGQNPEGGDS